MPRGDRGGPVSARAARRAVAAAVVLPLAVQLRVSRSARPPSERWQRVPVRPRGQTQLGISFRPRQAEAFGLDPDECLRQLLAYPFGLIRLGAYWNRIEPAPGRFCPDELDRQIAAAEHAGKQIVVCLGAVKTFGYPEFFVPDHYLPVPLPEGALISPDTHPRLLAAAVAQLTRLVERYRDRAAIVAWQVEHDAVDPLGMEHSWRLAEAFVEGEVAAVRAADPTRPVLLNGFLPTSTPVGLAQWWRTRDQGDSLAVAGRLADVVGLDVYPRHAVAGFGSWSLYLAGSRAPGPRWRRRRLTIRAAAAGRQLMVCEGQAEPWETTTTPPSRAGAVMASCPPERLVATYNECLRWPGPRAARLTAYLFWGAEYWLLRQAQGDPRYLGAFARILDES